MPFRLVISLLEAIFCDFVQLTKFIIFLKIRKFFAFCFFSFFANLIFCNLVSFSYTSIIFFIALSCGLASNNFFNCSYVSVVLLSFVASFVFVSIDFSCVVFSLFALSSFVLILFFIFFEFLVFFDNVLFSPLDFLNGSDISSS